MGIPNRHGDYSMGMVLEHWSNDPFHLGVASGDPSSDSVVLWTRLAPDPVDGGGVPAESIGGVPAESIEVGWEIARDEAMQQVVQQGTTIASPDLAHSVHVEVRGLQPNRWQDLRKSSAWIHGQATMLRENDC